MRRRQVLIALALSAASLAGCGAPGTPDERRTDADTATGAADPTATDAVTPPDDDPILFVLSNETEAQRTVTLTVTGPDGRRHVDESVTLGAGDSREYDSDIASPGEYDLRAAAEPGPERSLTLGIGAYDVRNGSNHYVAVRADEIEVYWEV